MTSNVNVNTLQSNGILSRILPPLPKTELKCYLYPSDSSCCSFKFCEILNESRKLYGPCPIPANYSLFSYPAVFRIPDTNRRPPFADVPPSNRGALKGDPPPAGPPAPPSHHFSFRTSTLKKRSESTFKNLHGESSSLEENELHPTPSPSLSEEDSKSKKRKKADKSTSARKLPMRSCKSRPPPSPPSPSSSSSPSSALDPFVAPRVNCYCGCPLVSPYSEPADVVCDGCNFMFHQKCLNEPLEVEVLHGDTMYSFYCKNCVKDLKKRSRKKRRKGKQEENEEEKEMETFKVIGKSWLGVVEVTLFNLGLKRGIVDGSDVCKEGREDVKKEDEHYWFREEEILKFIEENWSVLCFGLSRRFWRNAVLSTLGNDKFFKSRGNGLWSLLTFQNPIFLDRTRNNDSSDIVKQENKEAQGKDTEGPTLVIEEKDKYDAIEDILARRKTQNGFFQYKVKWIGKDNRYNAWVDQDRINPEKITGYLVKHKEEQKSTRRDKSESLNEGSNQPFVLPSFLPSSGKPPKLGFESGDVVKKIWGLNQVKGVIVYYVEWQKSGKRSWISSKVLSQKDPLIIIRFYESRIY